MPLYEFECEDHGVQELYFSLPNDVEQIECPTCVMLSTTILVATRVWSIPTMRPDKYWAGHIINNQYVTSQSEVATLMEGIEPATLNNIEYVSKRKKEVAKETLKKRVEATTDFLNEEFRGIDDASLSLDKTDTEESCREFYRQRNEYLMTHSTEAV